MKIMLPDTLRCARCTRRLKGFLYGVGDTDDLVCLFCARGQPAGTVAAVHISEYGNVEGERDPMDPIDAAALLIRHGAIIDPEDDD